MDFNVMESEFPIPTINSEFVAEVLDQVRIWNDELKEPWVPSPAALTMAQGLRNSCPTMAAALEKAGILEPFAEMLHDQVLDLKLANREAGMVPSEAMSQARMELVPSTPEMQEEWLAANCDDYEQTPDPDLHDQCEGAEGDFDDGEDELFRYSHGEGYLLKGKLQEAIRSILKSRNLSAREIMELGAFLWLVDQLPRHHEEFCGDMTLSINYEGEGSAWRSVQIGGEGLEIRRGETTRYEYGCDSHSETVYNVSRDTEAEFEQFCDLDDWLWHFVSDCGDSEWEISISWYPEDVMPGHSG